MLQIRKEMREREKRKKKHERAQVLAFSSNVLVAGLKVAWKGVQMSPGNGEE